MFDLAAYKRAFEAPPRAPVVMRGRAAILEFLREVAADPVRLSISDELTAGDRAAFTVTCDLGYGRRAIENTVVTLRDGLIIRQVEVEAWD